MRSRFVAWTALAALALLPRTAPAAEPNSAPALVVRLKSLDGLIADARYLAEVAGKGEEAKQAEGVLKNLAGPKGVEGIDTKRPLGLYGHVGAAGVDSTAVLLVPIADQDAALALLKRFVEVEKGDDGVYSLNIPRARVPVYFRFANGYACITARDKNAIDPERLLKPAEVLAPARVGTASLTVNLDRIPPGLTKQAIGILELALANAKEQERAGETPAQRQFKAAVLDEFAATARQVLTEGGAIDVRLDLDRKAGELSLSASLAARPDTKLAQSVADLGTVPSAVAGLVGSDSALNLLAHVRLPARVRQALAGVLDEAAERSLAKQKDETKRKLAESLWKAVAPTLKAAELDAGLSFRGPTNGKYALVVGARVKNGEGIEQAVRGLVRELPRGERERFTADVARAGNVSIHRLTPDRYDARAKELLGEHPVFTAARSDAVFVATGEGGLQALKDAVGAGAKNGPVAQLEISVARFARALEAENRGAVEAAKKAFADHPGGDTITVRLEGGPSLRLKAAMKTQLVRFIALMEEAKRSPSGGGDN